VINVDSSEARRWIIAALVFGVQAKVKFTLERGTKAQRWSRGIALLFL
jgi:hypothetical protein